jgi:hypothetical protein
LARLFDDTSSQYLNLGSAVLSAEPITVSAWFYTDDNAQSGAQTVFSLGSSSSSTHYFVLWWASATTTMEAIARAAAAARKATYSVTPTNNTWYHVGGIWATTTDRTVYFDGNTGNNTQFASPTVNQTSIGARWTTSASQFMSGRLADVGLWNVALTSTEMGMLQAGYSPWQVRRASLVAWWRLLGSEDQDLVAGNHLTAQGSPTTAGHPPIYNPLIRKRTFVVPSAPAVRIPRNPAAIYQTPAIY